MEEILKTIDYNINYMNLDITTSPDVNQTITNYLIKLILDTRDLIKVNKKTRKKFYFYHIKQQIKSFINDDPEWAKILNYNFFQTIIDNHDDQTKELLDFYFIINTIDNINKEKLNELYQIYKLFILIQNDRIQYIKDYKQIIFNRRKGIQYSYNDNFSDINKNMNIIKPKIKELSKEVPNE